MEKLPHSAARRVQVFFASAYWPQQVFVILFSTIVLYYGITFARTMYRLHWHPLAKFAGPREAALSDRWVYTQRQNGSPEAVFEALHREYNTTALRIAPDELHISDETMYKKIYSQVNPYPKKASFYAIFHASDALFGEINAVKHKERRKALNPVFSRAGILKLEPVFTATIEEFTQKFRKLCQKGPINVVDAYRCVTIDVISQFAFGRALGQLRENPDSFFTEFLDQDNKVGSSIWRVYYTPLLSLLTRLLPFHVLVKLDKNVSGLFNLHKLSYESLMAYKKRTKAPSHPVIFDHIDHWALKDQAEEAADVLIAGSATAAHTLSIATWHISSKAEIKQKLVSALQEAIPDPTNMPPLVELEKIPYLFACVKEALRVAMPNPGVLPRVVPHREEPLILEGKLVPPGTSIGMSAYTMHRKTSIWGPDAHAFNPDRWLDDKQKGLSDYMVAYSKGARSCIGMNVANAELIMILAHVYRQFETSVVDMCEPEIVDEFVAAVKSHQILVDFSEVTE